jgi:hypothetical protein
MELSLELDVLEPILIHDLEVSAEREMDGHAEVEVEGETKGRGEFVGVFHHVEGLLVVDWESVEELGKELTLGLLDELLDGLFVEGEETFHFRAELEPEGPFDLLILLTGFDSEDLVNLLELGVGFAHGALLLDLLVKVIDEFLDGVALEGDFDGVHALGSVSVLDVVTVEDVVGHAGVLEGQNQKGVSICNGHGPELV